MLYIRLLLLGGFFCINSYAIDVGKEFFKDDILIKDCKKTETNIECSKFNRKGIQSEFVSYDIKGIKKDGPYIKYYDDYAFFHECINECKDKKIVIESGMYSKGNKVGEWFEFDKNGKILKINNYGKSSLLEKARAENKKERYVPLVKYSGKTFDNATKQQVTNVVIND